MASGTGVIVDSGTTETFFSKKTNKMFMTMYKQLSGHDYAHSNAAALSLSLLELKALPPIVIILRGEEGKNVTLNIPPTQYLYQLSDGRYVGHFHFTDSGSAGTHPLFHACPKLSTLL